MTKISTQLNFKTFVGLIVLALITPLFFISLPTTPNTGIAHLDKLIHFIFHFSLTIWFLMAGERKFHVVFSALIYGICIELGQGLTASRSFEFLDIMANGTGALIGLMIYSQFISKYRVSNPQ